MGKLRARSGVALAILMVAGLFGVTTGSAAPVAYSTTPLATGWSTNGTVLSVLVVGDTVYAGGTFTAVRPSAGGPSVARSNLAAFDVHTGALLPGFSATFDDAVRTLASDGERLFVGGSFGRVSGVSRARVAALELTTGNVIGGFRADAGGHVYVLESAGSRLYIGGTFSAVNGQARRRIAAVDSATGAVDPGFRPDADNNVRGIAASPDGATVFVGGQFSSIGGGSRRYLAPVSASTGALLPLVFQHSQYGRVIDLDISPSGGQIVAALGDLENAAIAWDTVTGQREWVQVADGDTQAVSYHEGNVYFGFHEGFGGSTAVRVLAADADSGALEPAFRPAVNTFFGVWAIDGHRDAIVLGGEFTSVDGRPSQGIAILPRIGGVEPPPDEPPPDEPPPDEPPPDEPPPGDTGTVALVARGAEWRYTEDGLERGTAWKEPGYDDTAWPRGPAQLGYGDGDEATVISRGGPSTGERHLSHYLRRSFTVADASAATALSLDLLRDDGVVVYLNGTEVLRDNMPAGQISSGTYPTRGVWGAEEQAVTAHALPTSLLVDGTNVLAVSLHNESRSSSDLSFDAALIAEVSSTTPPVDPPPVDPPPVDPPPTEPVDETIVARGAVWRYTADGIERGSAWYAPGYDDSSWLSGAAQLGYGEGDEATEVYRGGPATAQRFLSHQLRHSFTVTGASSVTSLTLDLLRDDGAIVYLNGHEVVRTNLPSGVITVGTYASAGVWGAEEQTYSTFDVPAGLLVEGTNVLAVSVHNESRSSSDLSFDAALIAHR